MGHADNSMADRHRTKGVWIDECADEPDEVADLFGSPWVGDVAVPEDRLPAAAGWAAADCGAESVLGPAFQGKPRKATSRDTLQRLRHCLRLPLPAGSDHLPDQPHEFACRLLADKGLLFSEAMPILVEWVLTQTEPVGVEELEAESIAAMNEVWEAATGLKTAGTY